MRGEQERDKVQFKVFSRGSNQTTFMESQPGTRHMLGGEVCIEKNKSGSALK